MTLVTGVGIKPQDPGRQGQRTLGEGDIRGDVLVRTMVHDFDDVVQLNTFSPRGVSLSLCDSVLSIYQSIESLWGLIWSLNGYFSFVE